MSDSPEPQPTTPEEGRTTPALTPTQAEGLFDLGSAATAAPDALPAPSELQRSFPQFEILELLGRGGMGAVYKARQIALDRVVALKLLPPALGGDPEFTARFQREARAMARLNHPNIVTVHDFGQTPEGRLYFVMEFVDGTDLAQLIRAGFDPAQALGITAQICEALAYAHGEGIVHRDIKPANVMVDFRGRVKVADFGLARLIGGEVEASALTTTGTVMGTPDYMAPEQRSGMHVDHRADIYSLGVMLYEMFCHAIPRGIFDPPSARTGCDVRIDRIVARAMQSEPDRRFQSTQEMRAAIEAARTPAPAPMPHASPPPKPPALRAKKPAASQRRRSTAIAAAVLLLACGGWWLTHRKTDTVNPASAHRADATAGHWDDFLADIRAGRHPTSALSMREEDGQFRVIKAFNPSVAPTGMLLRNGALRITSSSPEGYDLQLRLRVEQDENDTMRRAYEAHFTRGKEVLLQIHTWESADDGGKTQPLDARRLPEDFDYAREHTYELRAVGDLLTVLLDGKEISSRYDRTLTDPGKCRAYLGAGTLIRELKVLNLDAPAK